MGALRGSISYTKFYVDGEVPADFQQTFLAAIQARKLEPLTHDSDDEQHHGWCAVDKPFELDLDHVSVFSNEYITLGMRVDKWRLQVPLLKAKVEEAEADFKARLQRERLGKRQRAEIKQTVTRLLRKQTIPVTKSYDMSWNMTEKVVLFWSKSIKVLDLFQELFEKTFKLKLLPENPITTATTRAQLSDGQCETLLSLTPSAFGHAVSVPSIGAEFLIWLWYESERNEGNFSLADLGDLSLWFENAITLESNAVQKEQSKLKGAAPSSTQEAREALRGGKHPVSARIRFEQGPQQFACAINAETMGLSSITIPTLLKSEQDERFYERMYLIEHLEKVLMALFAEFLRLRISPAWETTTIPSITAWINDSSA